MSFANSLTRFIDWFYIKPLQRFVSRQVFRYAVCGGSNLVLNWLIYSLIYHFILHGEVLDLGFVVFTPHVAAFAISFPITFLTGFWLQKHISFSGAPLGTITQLLRYAVSVAGSIVINYLCLKLFVEVCHIWPTPSQILSSLVTVVYSYFMQNYFTFRGNKG